MTTTLPQAEAFTFGMEKVPATCELSLTVVWKCGNEFAPYHHQASHVNPDHRDGWNACYRAAQSALVAQAAEKDVEIAALKIDAERYRWLRSEAEPNRGGEKPWCTVRDNKGYAWTLGPVLDAAIDSARALAQQEAK